MAQLPLPTLYVEGPDDTVFISNLLHRHGIDTQRGREHLEVKHLGSVEKVLDAIPDAVRNASNRPVGFVVDIDIVTQHRWGAIRHRLVNLGLNEAIPHHCPNNGYLGRIVDYPFEFGVWLMPDCQTDGQKLEDLIVTLLPEQHPLWQHAQTSTDKAAQLFDAAVVADSSVGLRWSRFSDGDRLKAQLRTWLAWQKQPGMGYGAAVNDKILNSDSPQALAFMDWMRRLFQFPISGTASPGGPT